MNQPSHSAASGDRAVPSPQLEAAYPQAFSSSVKSEGKTAYLSEPCAARLAAFFQAKGLAALKEEDRNELWYEDWISYQAKHRLFATLLCPGADAGECRLDLLTYARFLELLGYFSPAHGYTLHVSFLGLFAILTGENAGLKKEAVATLRAGGLLALGVSEKAHGSDLLGNELTVSESAPGRLVANGSKYYIGNSNCASIICVLARRGGDASAGRGRRIPFVLFALRPDRSTSLVNVRKIRTLGIRAAFVGEFDVKGHEFPAADVVAEGRGAWESILATVTLGKAFLGFGSVGICEHALEEAVAHLGTRILYGKPVTEMPHIRRAMARAYARLTAMKLYAYRLLDYLQSAHEADRRYLLFCAVQKAKVSTEGVKVMEDLSDCMGAKGFESDTYFEMALRDIQLIPRLEGSTHINLALTAQFIPRYFADPTSDVGEPDSAALADAARGGNPFLMSAQSGSIHAVGFPPCLAAYAPLTQVANVRMFVRQVRAFGHFVRSPASKAALRAGTETALALGQCQATIAYGQLVAEHSRRLGVAGDLLAAMFELLVMDLSTSALALAGTDGLEPAARRLIRRMVVAPRTSEADINAVADRLAAFGNTPPSPASDS